MTAYLTKILAAVCLVLFLSLCGVGYLYKESLKENGRLDTQIEQLEGDLKTCREDVKNVEGEKADVVQSFENVEKKFKKIEEDFDVLQNRLKDKQCGVKKKVVVNETNQINDPIADDIADTLRVLLSASCLSNKDCDDTGKLLPAVQD